MFQAADINPLVKPTPIAAHAPEHPADQCSFDRRLVEGRRPGWLKQGAVRGRPGQLERAAGLDRAQPPHKRQLDQTESVRARHCYFFFACRLRSLTISRAW